MPVSEGKAGQDDNGTAFQSIRGYTNELLTAAGFPLPWNSVMQEPAPSQRKIMMVMVVGG
jgi:hypothetical protein